MSDRLPPEDAALLDVSDAADRMDDHGWYSERDILNDAHNTLRSHITAQAEEIERLRERPEVHGTLKDGVFTVSTPLVLVMDNAGTWKGATNAFEAAFTTALRDRDRYMAIAQGFGLRLDEAYGLPPGTTFEEAVSPFGESEVRDEN